MSGGSATSLDGLDRLAGTAGFDIAMRRAAAGLVALRQRNRFTGWLLGDRALAILHHALICLDAEGDDDDPSSGLTPGRFKTLCAERGFCSPGRATAILAIMRASRMLHAAGSVADGRVVRLRPTERLREAARQRLRVQMEAFAALRPNLAASVKRLGCPSFERAAYRAFGERLEEGLRLMDLTPHLTPVARRDAGMLIMFALMVDAQREGPRGLEGELSISALARRLGTSRPHVLRVVREAEAAGLLTRTTDRSNVVQLTPLLVRSLTTFYAATIQLIDECTGVGLAAAPVCNCCPTPLTLPPQHAVA